VTPKYFGLLIQGMFSLNRVTGVKGPLRWLRLLENNETEDLCVLIWILQLRSHGSRRASAAFSFLTARPTLPERTLIDASSAYRVIARFGSVVMCGKLLIKRLNRVGPRRLPWGTPAKMG
jgi:hypothetical protein